MYNKQLILFLKCAAITGNILFILFILYNGAHEGFKGTIHEIVTYIAMIVLLALNSILLLIPRKEK